MLTGLLVIDCASGGKSANAVPLYVYILRNPQDRRYVGHSDDLTARVLRHNRGGVFSTRNRGPWELLFAEACDSRSTAVILERKLKSLRNRAAQDRYMQEALDSGRAMRHQTLSSPVPE